MAKTLDEKILMAREKVKQDDNQLKLLLQQKKEADRKARNHRLITWGAMLESLTGLGDNVTNAQMKEVLAVALSSDAGRKALFSLQNERAEEPANLPLSDMHTSILENPEQKSRRQKVMDLKTAAKVLRFLQKSGISDMAGLQNKVAETHTHFHGVSEKLKKK